MAQFYGTVQGCRGEASRLGSKQSGLQVKGNAWDIGAELYLNHDSDNDRDEVTVRLTGGSKGHICSKDLGTFVRSGEGYIRAGTVERNFQAGPVKIEAYRTEGGSASISTNLREVLGESLDCTVKALEAVMLAHLAAGVPIWSADYCFGIETAVEAFIG